MPESADRAPTEEPRVPFAERWLAPFVREPMLWPVGIVIVAHAIAFLAPVLLLALRDRRIGAVGALTGIVVLSGAATRAEFARLHRPGIVSALLGAIWAFAIALAFAADRAGVF